MHVPQLQVLFLLITLHSIVMPCPVRADAPAVAVESNAVDAGHNEHEHKEKNESIGIIHFILLPWLWVVEVFRFEIRHPQLLAWLRSDDLMRRE